MNELLAQLFGSQPSYAGQLLGEDEARRLQQQAQQSGLLNVGLALLAGAGPSPQRRGVGELLAQGVMAGQQAYQGAYDKAVRDRMLQEQLAERQQLRQEQQMAQQAISSAFAPREMYGEDIMGQRVGVGMTAPMLDMTRLQSMLGGLTPGARSQVLKEAAAIQGAFAPKRMTLREGEQILEETPEGLRAIAGAPKPEKLTSDIQEYNKAVEQGFKGSFLDYQTQLKQAGATRVNVDTAGPREFEKKAAGFAAENFNNLRTQANTASRNLIQVGRLENLLQSTGGGLVPQAKAIAGNLGIPTKGLDDIQAATAIVSQLVPQQRQAGSGTMSDKDVELFKSSLPRLINQPGGNQKIIDTIKAINQYDQQIGKIANDALAGKIKPQEADDLISKVPNPLAVPITGKLVFNPRTERLEEQK
jgi:hypothetical protein